MSSILPKVTQPSVQQTGTSFAVGSYRSLPPDYGAYSLAVLLLQQPQTDYVHGALTGYRSLTSYSGEDWQLLDAVRQLQDGRTSRGKSVTFGDGALDLWRLLIEQGGDIAKVIAAQ